MNFSQQNSQMGSEYDRPDETRTCEICNRTESADTFKEIIKDVTVDNYLRMKDYEMIQVNHRLPKMKATNGRWIERGQCRQTFHVRCIQDYICKQLAKNEGKAIPGIAVNQWVVRCAKCDAYDAILAKPYQETQIEQLYLKLGKNRIKMIENRNKDALDQIQRDLGGQKKQYPQ